MEMALENCRGSVVLLVTLTASLHLSIADLSATPLDDTRERAQITQHYVRSMATTYIRDIVTVIGFLRSFSNVRDVGIVQIKVLRAEGLMAADVTGKSDPFCVVELNNDRLQTHTVYKNLNPEWNKVFTFNVKDIHAVLEVTVLDEDRDRSADFLGKVAIPLLYVRNGEQKGYALKNKQLTGPKKGVVYLEIDVIYNTVKAALKTIVPAENKYIEEEPKVSKYLLQQNFNRVKRCIMVLINMGTYINSCFEWESAQRSIISFVVFVLVVWNFELYMLPLALLLLLVWNYVFSFRETTDTSMEAMFDWEDEEEDEKESERKGFMDKLYAIQDVFLSVQTALDEVASYGERIKKWVLHSQHVLLPLWITVNWAVPFLSWLAVMVLCVAMVLLYFLPLRYLVLAWGRDTEGLSKLHWSHQPRQRTATPAPAPPERQRRPAEERGGSAATATGNRLLLASPGSSLEQPRPAAPLPGDQEPKAPCSRRRWEGDHASSPWWRGVTTNCSRPSESYLRGPAVGPPPSPSSQPLQPSTPRDTSASRSSSPRPLVSGTEGEGGVGV
ncbi:Multiple C2 and transmembrane domain-containing protein 1 [Merluccius polli]|uniref:Multiple C2 and transmembrane domain-containing protein 1 n=1 Tax=Merluccius polli TaxID=89951 RepID=A0AA47M6R5_MERPO|nr:Multiple C2 and transmembrane domain-containing protein 1 [Merluccius polli]